MLLPVGGAGECVGEAMAAPSSERGRWREGAELPQFRLKCRTGLPSRPRRTAEGAGGEGFDLLVSGICTCSVVVQSPCENWDICVCANDRR